MIKKEYIQPTVKEIKINLPVVLASGSNENEPTWDPNEEEDQEGDLG